MALEKNVKPFSFSKHGGFCSVENPNVKTMDSSFSLENKPLVPKFCMVDHKRCYNKSCDIVSVDGSVVPCRRRRGFRGRFTKANNGSVV